MIDWRGLLTEADPSVVAILDIHHAEFDMPFHDRDWLAHHPDLEVAEFVEVLRQSVNEDPGHTPFEQRRAYGRRLLARAAQIRSDRRSG